MVGEVVEDELTVEEEVEDKSKLSIIDPQRIHLI
jgi:hypothetical protein